MHGSSHLNQTGIIIAGSERENELNAALTDHKRMAEDGDAEMRLLHLLLDVIRARAADHGEGLECDRCARLAVLIIAITRRGMRKESGRGVDVRDDVFRAAMFVVRRSQSPRQHQGHSCNYEAHGGHPHALHRQICYDGVKLYYRIHTVRFILVFCDTISIEDVRDVQNVFP
jgi:hypothetical protein